MAKIAIISDLHIGVAARSPDLNPHPVTPAVPSDGFLDSFERLADSAGIHADILFVPGDISDKAHPLEYVRATQVIQRVAAALGVPDDSIFPVLGNHDLNWALIDAVEGAPELGHALRFAPVQNSEWLRGHLTSGVGQSQLAIPFLSIDETSDFFIVRYNSAEADLPDVKPHRGAIQQNHLDALRVLLDANPPPQDKVKVFLTHHHPKIYSDPIPDLPDFSALVNAEALIDLLRAMNFDLIVHGHKHAPKFSSSVEAGGGALSILCAGSFSRSIESMWVGKITNQFHLVDCGERDPHTGYLQGQVISWAYQPRAWIPSDRKWAGIAHRIPFGAYPSETELANKLRSAIILIAAERHVTWGDLVDVEPKIQFSDAGLIERILRAIAEELAMILVFRPDEPNNLAMVRP